MMMLLLIVDATVRLKFERRESTVVSGTGWIESILGLAVLSKKNLLGSSRRVNTPLDGDDEIKVFPAAEYKMK